MRLFVLIVETCATNVLSLDIKQERKRISCETWNIIQATIRRYPKSIPAVSSSPRSSSPRSSSSRSSSSRSSSWQQQPIAVVDPPIVCHSRETRDHRRGSASLLTPRSRRETSGVCFTSDRFVDVASFTRAPASPAKTLFSRRRAHSHAIRIK